MDFIHKSNSQSIEHAINYKESERNYIFPTSFYNLKPNILKIIQNFIYKIKNLTQIRRLIDLSDYQFRIINDLSAFPQEEFSQNKEKIIIKTKFNVNLILIF